MMNASPYFTIGIPTYNRAELLSESLNSALQQTDPDFELLVSDNASSDHTAQVMQARMGDPRLRCFRQATNLGAQRNCMLLLEQARGEFFVLLQDDDLLHPDFLKRCRQAVNNRPQVGMFAGGMLSGKTLFGVMQVDLRHRESIMRPIQGFSTQAIELSGVEAAVMLLLGLPFIHPGIALRTARLREMGGFVSEVGYASDNIYLARMALRGTVMYDPNVVAFIRTHQGSFSAGVNRKERLTCRRIANERIIRDLAAVDPCWHEYLPRCLECLPPRRKQRLLVEVWEGYYPKIIRDRVTEAVLGTSPWRKWLLPFQSQMPRALLRGFRARLSLQP